MVPKASLDRLGEFIPVYNASKISIVARFVAGKLARIMK